MERFETDQLGQHKESALQTGSPNASASEDKLASSDQQQADQSQNESNLYKNASLYDLISKAAPSGTEEQTQMEEPNQEAPANFLKQAFEEQSKAKTPPKKTYYDNSQQQSGKGNNTTPPSQSDKQTTSPSLFAGGKKGSSSDQKNNHYQQEQAYFDDSVIGDQEIANMNERSVVKPKGPYNDDDDSDRSSPVSDFKNQNSPFQKSQLSGAKQNIDFQNITCTNSHDNSSGRLKYSPALIVGTKSPSQGSPAKSSPLRNEHTNSSSQIQPLQNSQTVKRIPQSPTSLGKLAQQQYVIMGSPSKMNHSPAKQQARKSPAKPMSTSVHPKMISAIPKTAYSLYAPVIQQTRLGKVTTYSTINQSQQLHYSPSKQQNNQQQHVKHQKNKSFNAGFSTSNLQDLGHKRYSTKYTALRDGIKADVANFTTIEHKKVEVKSPKRTRLSTARPSSPQVQKIKPATGVNQTVDQIFTSRDVQKTTPNKHMDSCTPQKSPTKEPKSPVLSSAKSSKPQPITTFSLCDLNDQQAVQEALGQLSIDSILDLLERTQKKLFNSATLITLQVYCLLMWILRQNEVMDQSININANKQSGRASSASTHSSKQRQPELPLFKVLERIFEDFEYCRKFLLPTGSEKDMIQAATRLFGETQSYAIKIPLAPCFKPYFHHIWTKIEHNTVCLSRNPIKHQQRIVELVKAISGWHILNLPEEISVNNSASNTNSTVKYGKEQDLHATAINLSKSIPKRSKYTHVSKKNTGSHLDNKSQGGKISGNISSSVSKVNLSTSILQQKPRPGSSATVSNNSANRYGCFSPPAAEQSAEAVDLNQSHIVMNPQVLTPSHQKKLQQQPFVANYTKRVAKQSKPKQNDIRVQPPNILHQKPILTSRVKEKYANLHKAETILKISCSKNLFN